MIPVSALDERRQVIGIERPEPLGRVGFVEEHHLVLPPGAAAGQARGEPVPPSDQKINLRDSEMFRPGLDAHGLYG